MKANEVPEKIYIFEQDFQRKDHKVMYGVNQDKDIKGLIEYTRTDAFIKKVCDWLRTHSEADYFELIPDYNYCGAGNLNKKKMIEDFEEYMRD